MGVLIDITGERFGRLIVLRKSDTKKRLSGRRDVFWICQCDCGNIVEVQRDNLKLGNTKSCGCLNIDRITKHGMVGTNIYDAWISMVTNHKLEVTEAWLNFENFYKDMGVKESEELVLFRYDNEVEFNKTNCFWKRRGYINIQREGFGNSKYKGVHYEKSRNKYQSSIKINGKRYFLGRYSNEKDAAIAYNKKSLETYGEFANLNIID